MIDKGDPEACWPWPGHRRAQSGYGWTGTQLAHRWSYEKHVGPIPCGRQVDHACHGRDEQCPGGADCSHRFCVNPAHLEVVTQPENLRRGRQRLTECKRGHPIQRDANGHWKCAECSLARKRAWNAAHREEDNRRRRERYAQRRRS